MQCVIHFLIMPLHQQEVIVVSFHERFCGIEITYIGNCASLGFQT